MKNLLSILIPIIFFYLSFPSNSFSYDYFALQGLAQMFVSPCVIVSLDR